LAFTVFLWYIEKLLGLIEKGENMSEEAKTPKEIQIQRIFEQPPDAISFYSDMAQILSTGNEVIIQFYEAIPGPPAGPAGQITNMRTRLRSTVTVSFSHARNIGKLLIEKTPEEKK
jgi:hypothetical protein